MLTRQPAIGKNYEILITRAGQESTVFEPEKVTERPIEKISDRKPLTRGGRIVRRPHIQGYELSVEGAIVDPVMHLLLGIRDRLNIKGEQPDPFDYNVIVRVSFPHSLLVQESTYTEVTFCEPEWSADDLDNVIVHRFKITAVHKNHQLTAVPGLNIPLPPLGALPIPGLGPIPIPGVPSAPSVPIGGRLPGIPGT